MQPDAARETLAEAKAWGLEPSLRLFNLVVIAHARAGRAADAEAFVHGEMAADGLAPDLVTWCAPLVKTCCETLCPGLQVLRLLLHLLVHVAFPELGSPRCTACRNSMLAAFAGGQDVDAAYRCTV